MNKHQQTEQLKTPEHKVTFYQDSHGHHIILPTQTAVTLSDINSRWFDASYWQSNDRITGQSKGRNITWFIKAPSKAAKMHWVLRHYYRGGLVSKISNDSYFFKGLKKTRAYQEVNLLQEMIALKLPVPKPIAARVIKKGLFYRADLLMEKLEGEDLVHRLKKEALADLVWESIGKTIANFHNLGIYHADLNAHNILLDKHNKVWLIDFDRCQRRPIQSQWQKSNMNRLIRSFAKESSINNSLQFQDNDWQLLKKGYNSVIQYN
jgi:3-deoxy-D-manno-octulosonic acid kinase